MIQKKKVKLLPSSLREKKRYIVFITRKQLNKRIITTQLLSFLGVYGFAKANPKIIYFNENTGKGIIRVKLSEINKVISQLLMLRDHTNNIVPFEVLSISGSLKKAKGF